MINYLAIDSSNKHLTIIACKGGNKAVRYIPDCALHHSVRIMAEITSALDELALTPQECGFFCAVTGPGSFTGIRIGIAAAKGFAVGAEKPTMPVTAFEMIAYNVKDTDFVVAIDAAHGHYYTQKFTGGTPCAPAYVSKEELISYGLPIYGYEKLLLPQYALINAATALENAVESKLNAGNAYGELTALYVRKSQAEEGRA